MMYRRLLLCLGLASLLLIFILHSDISALGGPYFADVTQQAGIEATHRALWDPKETGTGYLAVGQAWGDYNRDGWVDLYVTGNLDPNTLYLNNKDGSFTVSPLSEQVSLADRVSGGAVWADYDNDGWRDLYVLNQGSNSLFRNNQGQSFINVTLEAGVGDIGKGETATWGDYDNDGHLDLYVVNWTCLPECQPVDYTLQQDRLYHNNGNGTFTDVSGTLTYEKLLGAGFSASFMDYDNDGDADLYVVNDEFENPIGNVLWRNDGPGCGHWCWTDVSTGAGADTVTSAMGLAVGDYDNDNDLDFYFSNMINRMTLLQNQGDGEFVSVGKEAGVSVGATPAVAWGTAFFDYDNDGWLDLSLVTTKFIQQEIYMEPEGMHFAYPNFLFHNNGDGTFTDVSEQSWLENMAASKGFAYADYDNDGWLDFVIGNWNEGYTLYHNEGLAGTGNHWLAVRLIGCGPVNRDGIGARVYLTTSEGQTLMQEVKSGSSLGAGNDTTLHFGLGSSPQTKQITIVWPDGLRQVYDNLSGDKVRYLAYPTSACRS